jgi:hypothetical protein
MKIRIATMRRIARFAPQTRLPRPSSQLPQEPARVDMQSVAGEEDPGAALDLPRTARRS